MASTTTGNAVPLALGHRDRCGSGGGAEAGHASLRAFAVAHAAFDTPSQLGGDPSARRLAHAAPAPAPGAPVFVFGCKCASCGGTDAAGEQPGPECAGAKAREPATWREAAGESAPSRFAAAAREPRAAVREGAPPRCPAPEPSATVFGPDAPRERKVEPVVAPIAPKRAREVPAVDDVVTLFERCAASDDLDDVDRAAELLSGCCVPGKRPRTAEAASIASSLAEVAVRPKVLRDLDEGAAQAKAATVSAATSAADSSDDASPDAASASSAAAAPSKPAHDTGEGAIEKHDDDELSFLVTRCDIDSGNRTEPFMPYIS